MARVSPADQIRKRMGSAAKSWMSADRELQSAKAQVDSMNAAEIKKVKPVVPVVKKKRLLPKGIV